eukprot:33848_1
MFDRRDNIHVGLWCMLYLSQRAIPSILGSLYRNPPPVINIQDNPNPPPNINIQDPNHVQNEQSSTVKLTPTPTDSIQLDINTTPSVYNSQLDNILSNKPSKQLHVARSTDASRIITKRTWFIRYGLDTLSHCILMQLCLMGLLFTICIRLRMFYIP